MVRYANKKSKDYKLKVEDRVLLSTKILQLDSGSITRKLHPKYCGPSTFRKQISPVTFKLKLTQPMLPMVQTNPFISAYYSLFKKTNLEEQAVSSQE